MDFFQRLRAALKTVRIFFAALAGVVPGVQSTFSSTSFSSEAWCCNSIFEPFVSIRDECTLLKDILGTFAQPETFDRLTTTNGVKAVQALDTFLGSVAENNEIPTLLAPDVCQAGALDFRLTTIANQLNTLNTDLLKSLGTTRTQTHVDDVEDLRKNQCQGLRQIRQSINEAIDSIQLDLKLWIENFQKATYIYDQRFYDGASRLLTSLRQINDWMQAMPPLEEFCKDCQAVPPHPDETTLSDELLEKLNNTETCFAEIVPLLNKTHCPYCSDCCGSLRASVQNLHTINQALLHAADGFASYSFTSTIPILNDLIQGTETLQSISTLLQQLMPNTQFACPFRNRSESLEAIGKELKTLTNTVVDFAQKLNPSTFAPAPLSLSAEEDSCQVFETLWSSFKSEFQTLTGTGSTGGLKALQSVLTSAPFMTTDNLDTAVFNFVQAAQTLTPAHLNSLASAFSGGCSHGAFEGIGTAWAKGLPLLEEISDACSYAAFWKHFIDDLAQMDDSLKTIAACFKAFAGTFQEAATEKRLSSLQTTVLQGLAQLAPVGESSSTDMASFIQALTNFFTSPPSTNFRTLRAAFLEKLGPIKERLASIAQKVEIQCTNAPLTLAKATTLPSLSSLKDSAQTTVSAFNVIMTAFKHLGYDETIATSFKTLSNDFTNLATALNGSSSRLATVLQKNAAKLGNNPPLPYSELPEIATLLSGILSEHEIQCHALLLKPLQSLNQRVQHLRIILETLATKTEYFVDTLEETLWIPVVHAINTCLETLQEVDMASSSCSEEAMASYLTRLAETLLALETVLKEQLPDNPLQGTEDPTESTLNNCATLLNYRTNIATTLSEINELFTPLKNNFNASKYTYSDDLQTAVKILADNLYDLCQKSLPVLEDFCSLCTPSTGTDLWKRSLQSLQTNFDALADDLMTSLCCPPLCLPVYQGTQYLTCINQALGTISENMNRTISVDARNTVTETIHTAATILEDEMLMALGALVPSSAICSLKGLEQPFQTVTNHLKTLAETAVTLAKTLNPNAVASSNIGSYGGTPSCTALATLWSNAKTQIGLLTGAIQKVDTAFKNRQFVVEDNVAEALNHLVSAFNKLLESSDEERRFTTLERLFAQSSRCSHGAFAGFDEELQQAQTLAEDLSFKVRFSTVLHAIDASVENMALCLTDFDQQFQVLSSKQVLTIEALLNEIELSALTRGVGDMMTLLPFGTNPLRTERAEFLTSVEFFKDTLSGLEISTEKIWKTIFGTPFVPTLSSAPTLTSIQNHVTSLFSAYAAFIERFKHAGYEATIGTKLAGFKSFFNDLKSALDALQSRLKDNADVLSSTLPLPYAELTQLSEILASAPDQHTIECHALLLEPLKRIRLGCVRAETFLRFLASTPRLFVESEEVHWLAAAKATQSFLESFHSFSASTLTCASERFAADLTTLANLIDDWTLNLEGAFPDEVTIAFTDPDVTALPSLHNCASLIWCRERIVDSIKRINDLFTVWTENFEQSHYTYNTELQTTVQAIAAALNRVLTRSFPTLESLCSLCTPEPHAWTWKSVLTTSQRGFAEMATLLKTSLCCRFLCPSLEKIVYQLRRLHQALPNINRAFEQYLPTRNPSLIASIQTETALFHTLREEFCALTPSTSVCPFKGREEQFEEIGTTLERLVDVIVASVPLELPPLEKEPFVLPSCEIFEQLWEQIAEQTAQFGSSLEALDDALIRTDLIYDEALKKAFELFIAAVNNFAEEVNFEEVRKSFSPEGSPCCHSHVFENTGLSVAHFQAGLGVIQATLSERCCTLTLRTLQRIGQTLNCLTSDVFNLQAHYQNKMLEHETGTTFREWPAAAEALLAPLSRLHSFWEQNIPQSLHVTVEDWLDVLSALEVNSEQMETFLETLHLKRTPSLDEDFWLETRTTQKVFKDTLESYVQFANVLEALATTLESDPPLHANIPALLDMLPVLSTVFTSLETELVDQAQMKKLCFEEEDEAVLMSTIDAAHEAADVVQHAFARIHATLSVPGCCLEFAQEFFKVVHEADVLGNLMKKAAALGEVIMAPEDVPEAEELLKTWRKSFEDLTGAIDEWKESLDIQVSNASEETPTPYCLYKETNLSTLRTYAEKMTACARPFLKLLGAEENGEPEVRLVDKTQGCANLTVGVRWLTGVLSELKTSLDTLLTNFLKPTDRPYYPALLAEFRTFGARFETFCETLITTLETLPLEVVCESCPHPTGRQTALTALKQAIEVLPPCIKGTGSLEEAWTFYDDSTLNKLLPTLVENVSRIVAVLKAIGSADQTALILNASFHNAIEPSLSAVTEAYAEWLESLQFLKGFLADQGREALILDPTRLNAVLEASTHVREKMEVLAAFIGTPLKTASPVTFNTYYHNTDEILGALAKVFSEGIPPIQAILAHMEDGASYNTPKAIVALLKTLSSFDGSAILTDFTSLINHRLNLQPALDQLVTTATEVQELFGSLATQFERPTYFNAVEQAAIQVGLQARILMGRFEQLATQNFNSQNALTQLETALNGPLPRIVSLLQALTQTLQTPFPQDQETVDAVTEKLTILNENGFKPLAALMDPLLDNAVYDATSPTTVEESLDIVGALFQMLANFLNQRAETLPPDFVYQNEAFQVMQNFVAILKSLFEGLRALSEVITNPSCVFEPNIKKQSLISVTEAALQSVAATQHLADAWQAHCCDPLVASLEHVLEAFNRLQYGLKKAVDENPAFADHLFRTTIVHPLLEALAEDSTELFTILTRVWTSLDEAQNRFVLDPNFCFTSELTEPLADLAQALNAVADEAKTLYEKTGNELIWPKKQTLASVEDFWPRILQTLGGLNNTVTCVVTLHEQNTYEVNFDKLIAAFGKLGQNLTGAATQLRQSATNLRPLCAANRSKAKMPLLAGATTLEDMAYKLLNLAQKTIGHCQAFLAQEELLSGLLQDTLLIQQALLNTVEDRINEKPVGSIEPEDEALLTDFMELEAQMGSIIFEKLIKLTDEIHAAGLHSREGSFVCYANRGVPFLEAMAHGIQAFIHTARELCDRHMVRLRLSTHTQTVNFECQDRNVFAQTIIQSFVDWGMQWETFANSWNKVTVLYHRNFMDKVIVSLQTAFKNVGTAFEAWSVEAGNVCWDCEITLKLPAVEPAVKAFDRIFEHTRALCPSIVQSILDQIGAEIATMALAMKQAADRFELGLTDPLGVTDPLHTLTETLPKVGAKIATLNEHLSAFPNLKKECIAEDLNPWTEALLEGVVQLGAQMKPIAAAARVSIQRVQGTTATLEAQSVHLINAWKRFFNILNRETPDAQRSTVVQMLNPLLDSLTVLERELRALHQASEQGAFCNQETLASFRSLSEAIRPSVEAIREAAEDLKRNLAACNCCDTYAACLYQLGQNVGYLTTCLEKATLGELFITTLASEIERSTEALINLRKRWQAPKDTPPLCLFRDYSEEFKILSASPLVETSSFPDWDAFSFEDRNDCHFIRDLYRGLLKRFKTFFRTFLKQLPLETGEAAQLDTLESAFITCAKELKTTASELMSWDEQGIVPCATCSLNPGETASYMAQIGTLFQQSQETLAEKRRFQTAQNLQAKNEAVAMAANRRLGVPEEEQVLRPILLQAERPRTRVLEIEARLACAERQAANAIRKIWGE